MFRPESIVVVGGGFWCENVIRECRKSGFDGRISAVHPTRNEICGSPVVRSVSELSFVPDAAFIGVNRHATIETVRAFSKSGAGGAVCFASGFREASAELDDGVSLQNALVEAAGGMPFLGPNCYGFINALDGVALWPDQHGLAGANKGVAILTQSSNIALNLTMQTRGLPIAYLVTVGNQAQTGLSAIAEALLSDERVTAIGLHIEGLDDLAEFAGFAQRAHALGKPVVVLKVGRSQQAQTAAVSHTASLAGSAAGASALFKRLWFAEVTSLAAFLETLKLLHTVGPLSNYKIASMSCSGGEASLIADAAMERRLEFPALSDAQSRTLQEALGAKVALANPLDYHTYIWGDVDAMGRVFSAMMDSDAAMGLVVLDFPRSDRCSLDEWLKVIDAVDIAGENTGKPIGILSSLPENMPEDVALELLDKGINPFCGMEESLAAIEAAAFLGKRQLPDAIFVPTAPNKSVHLDEVQAKKILKKHGVAIPDKAVAHSGECAAEAAEEIGFPVVLKGIGFAHKSEAGAVKLDLNSIEDVLVAASGMATDAFLVEEMVAGALAELLVGVMLDPAHGYVLTLAAGGVLTELFDDNVSLILPVTRDEVDNALEGLKIARVLNGYRGKPACNRSLIIDAIMAVQDYVLSTAVAEVEINPLLCGETFAVAADALIRCEVS